jgi:hypothetical protein
MYKSAKHFLLLAVAATAFAVPAKAAEPSDELFPPNAKPGECYTRVFVPPVYRTETETVLKRAEYQRLGVTPPKFVPETETVMVREASERLEVVPATYEWVEETILAKPASKRLIQVPAVMETVEERMMVKPAHTTWKRGRGPIEKVNNGTGEIMCLIEVPAEYKTVSRSVVKTPAHTKEVEIPAEYKTVKKRVMKTPSTTRKIAIPAEYNSVSVMKLAEEPQVAATTVPAEHQTYSHTVKVSDGQMAWRQILCETNMDRATVMEIQRKLQAANHYGGPIDGIIGSQTMQGIRSFQRAKGLPEGGLTMDAIRSLGVRIASTGG